MFLRVDQKSSRPEKVVVSPKDAVAMVQLDWGRDLKAVHTCTTNTYIRCIPYKLHIYTHSVNNMQAKEANGSDQKGAFLNPISKRL